MKVSKLSISLNAEQAEEVREAARQAGLSVSAWIAEACAARLRSTHLREFLDDYQAEHGAFTEEELRQAAEELGFVPATEERRAS